MAEHDDRAFLELIGALAPCGESAPDKAARTWEGVMKRAGLRPRRKRRIAPRTLLVAAALLATTVLAAAGCLTAGDLFGGLLYESDGDGHFLPASSDSPMLERYGATLDLPPVKENGLTIQPRGFIGGGGHYELFLDVAADPGVPLRLAQADGTLSDGDYMFRDVSLIPGPGALKQGESCRCEIRRVDNGADEGKLSLLVQLDFEWTNIFRGAQRLDVELVDFQQVGWPPAKELGIRFENMQQVLDAAQAGKEIPFADRAGMTLTHASYADGVLSLEGNATAPAWEVAPSLRDLRHGRLFRGGGSSGDFWWEAQFDVAQEDLPYLEFVADTTLGDFTLVPGTWKFRLPLKKENLAKEVSLGGKEFWCDDTLLTAERIMFYSMGANLWLKMDKDTTEQILNSDRSQPGSSLRMKWVMRDGEIVNLRGFVMATIGTNDEEGYLNCQFTTGDRLLDYTKIAAVQFGGLEFPVS